MSHRSEGGTIEVFIIFFVKPNIFTVRFFLFTKSLFPAVLVTVMDIRIMSCMDTAQFFRHSVHSHVHFSDGSLRSHFHLQSLLPASLVWREIFALENICLIADLCSLVFIDERE